MVPTALPTRSIGRGQYDSADIGVRRLASDSTRLLLKASSKVTILLM